MSLRHNLHLSVRDYLCFGGDTFIINNMLASADVRVRVGSRVVAVPIEQPVILVLVIVATDIKHNTGRRTDSPDILIQLLP